MTPFYIHYDQSDGMRVEFTSSCLLPVFTPRSGPAAAGEPGLGHDCDKHGADYNIECCQSCERRHGGCELGWAGPGMSDANYHPIMCRHL